ncbi:CHAT domain-containing protein [Streptomyces sp.]|uniref:CHAT domain-containing protein n=1 Tax=Streptomyces sp. TaxID=1931 RepID=UPI002D78BB6C|nr:CHAT domain-containing protein [Streptomyces sp.]HET6353459.1 CHAT domain-containing protein [Streptomyces sp.]
MAPADISPGDFAVLRLDVAVGEWRESLAAGGIGVVVDERGRAVTCLRPPDLEGWADTTPAAEVLVHCPEGVLIPWDGEEPLRAALETVADRFMAEPGDRLPPAGVIVVDHLNRPLGVIRRRTLLRALLGRPGGDGYRSIPVTGDAAGTARFGRLLLPGEVRLRERTRLRVVVAHDRSVADDVELRVAPRAWPLSITVSLVDVGPQDFLVEGPDAAVLTVPEDGDSGELAFTLIPQTLGPKVLRVRFEHDHEFLRIARIRTEVVAVSADGAPASVDASPLPAHRAAVPDVTLHVTRDGPLGYLIRARTREDEPGTQPRLVDRIVLDRSPEDFVEAAFGDLESATGSTGFDKVVRRVGSALYDRLFKEGPSRDGVPGFDAFYWQDLRPRSEADDPERRWRTLQVVSDDPYIPWEILRPNRRLADGRWESDTFLCERFDLSRWLSEVPVAAAVPLRRVALVAPPSNLVWVAPEIQAIRELVPQVEEIADKDALDDFLRHGFADVVHFACHGDFGQLDAARSVVWIGDRRFSPMEITGEYRNFGRYRPLVFLNGCDTGRVGAGISGLEGWAREFLKAGASVFVGSLWATSDAAACQFAIAFYAGLAEGATVGEAVRAGREAAVLPDDASHLSYCVFANPCIRATGATT